jgi:type VI secretion system protein ImpH
VTFLGIYGSSSPLPSYLTQDLLDLEERGALQRRFLDLFNHRILSLFYRAARKYRCADAEEAGREGPWARRILALLGLGRPGADAGDRRFDGLQLIRFAPFLVHSPRSAAALEACLRRQFPGIPLAVEPFAASWTPIPGDQRSRLGVQGVALGRDFWLGEQVCNRSTTFRVAIGPLGYDDFLAFLPGGARRDELEALLKVFNPDGLDCELAVSVTIRPASGAADADDSGHGFTSATLGDESQQLGLNVRLGAGDDPPGAVHTVRSTIKG